MTCKYEMVSKLCYLDQVKIQVACIHRQKNVTKLLTCLCTIIMESFLWRFSCLEVSNNKMCKQIDQLHTVLLNSTHTKHTLKIASPHMFKQHLNSKLTKKASIRQFLNACKIKQITLTRTFFYHISKQLAVNNYWQ